MAAVKPIIVFWVDSPSTDTPMILRERMADLTRYIEIQRKDEGDFDFFVIPRRQDVMYDVQILNPVPVTEEAYLRLRKYAEKMLEEANSKINI